MAVGNEPCDQVDQEVDGAAMAAGIAAIKGNQVFGPYGNTRDVQGTINTAKGFTGSLIFLICAALQYEFETSLLMMKYLVLVIPSHAKNDTHFFSVPVFSVPCRLFCSVVVK